MSPAELHVVFGTGPVGQATARALVALGKTVRMVNRSGRAPDAPQGVTIVAADANTPSAALEAARGAVAVYQCAQPGYAEWVDKFPALQASILAAAAGAGARFIVADNLYMYGEVDGPIHEDLPYTATTRKGRVRAAMAEAVLSAHRAGKVRAAIARASDFYGPGVLGSAYGERMIQPLLAGKAASLAGGLDVPHSATYIDDFGITLAVLGTRDAALGQVWHVPNAPAVTQRELVRLAAQAAGCAPKVSAANRMMMRFFGLFVREAGEIVEMMYEFEKPFVVADGKFRRAFPDVLSAHMPMPLDEGMRRTVAWYRKHAG